MGRTSRARVQSVNEYAATVRAGVFFYFNGTVSKVCEQRYRRLRVKSENISFDRYAVLVCSSSSVHETIRPKRNSPPWLTVARSSRNEHTIEIDRFRASRLSAHPVRTRAHINTCRRGVGIIIVCCCCCAANFHRKSAAEVINLATPRRPRPSTGRSFGRCGEKSGQTRNERVLRGYARARARERAMQMGILPMGWVGRVGGWVGWGLPFVRSAG